MKKTRGLSDKTSDIILVVLCGIIMLLVAYPLYYVVVASVSNPYDVYAGKTFLLPSEFTLKGYSAVFADDSLLRGFINSVKYTVIGTVFSVVMLYVTAYPLAQTDLPGRKFFSIFFLITMYFGGGLVPTYLVVKQTGLLYNMWALFLPGGVAVGDGVDYEKYEGNPVITGADIPEGNSPLDFRDPKLWREPDGTYRAVVGNRTADGSGAVLLYESDDGFHWRFVTVVDACQNEYGLMWECPDFFPLDGKQVLVVSPQEMLALGLEFHAGNGNIAFLGTWENDRFTRERVQSIDYGIDFYAAQTMQTYDGRRVMIAWMQSWTNSNCQPQNARIFGEMTLPRELTIRDGRLIQNPVRELENYHGHRVAYSDVLVTGETNLPGVSGRVLDMTVTVRPAGGMYHAFRLNVAKDGEHVTYIRYKPEMNVIRVDRSRCGIRYDVVHVREFQVRPRNGEIKLRLVMDRHSLELFVNDGEQAATFILYAPETADSISFQAEGGAALVDVEKYDLDL